jgi:hypothetical protein
MFDEVGQWC